MPCNYGAHFSWGMVFCSYYGGCNYSVPRLLMDGIVADTKQISLIVSAGSTLSLVVLLLFLSRKKEFKYFGVELPIRFFPQIAILPTLVHLFLFLRLRDKVQSHTPVPDFETWEKIIAEGGWVFNGMQKRLDSGSRILSLDVVNVAENDFAFIASSAFAILLFAALSVSLFPNLINSAFHCLKKPRFLNIYSFRIPKVRALVEAFLKIFILISLPVVNWMIGSGWAIEVSSLSP